MGALALALGIGAAVTTFPGAAAAENPSGGEGNEQTSSQTQDTDDNTPEDDGEGLDTEDLDEPDPADDDDPPVDDDDLGDDEVDPPIVEPDDADGDPLAPGGGPGDGTNTDDGTGVDLVDGEIPPAPTDPTITFDPSGLDARGSDASQHDLGPTDDAAALSAPAARRPVIATDRTSTGDESAQPHTLATFSALTEPTTSNAAVPQPLTAPTAPAAYQAPLTLITSVLSAALAPFVLPGPATPLQTSAFAGLLLWVRREITRTFFNSTPTLVDNQDSEQIDADTVEGSVTGADPDLDPLSYSVSGGDSDADITIDENGNWSYTAPDDWDGSQPLTDTFTVTVTDEPEAGFHLHSLLSFLAPSRAHTDTQTITVTLPPSDTNQPPQVVSTVLVGEPDESTGAVTYEVIVRDDDGDTTPPTVTAARPAGGTGTVETAYVGANADGTHTYTVTYTPYPTSRVRAYNSTTPVTDTVTLTVADSDPATADTTQTIQPTIDPTQRAVLAAVPGENGYQSAFLVVGPDGTEYLFTENYVDDGTDTTTVTALNDPDFTPVVVPGYAEAPIFDEDGNGYVAFSVNDPDDDTWETSVVVINNPDIEPLTLPGYAAGPVVFDSAGNAYLVTVVDGGSNSDESTVTVINNADIEPVTYRGEADEPVVIGNDGTVYLTYESETESGATQTTVVAVNDPAVEPVVIPGRAAGPVVVADNGHVYQTTENVDGVRVVDVSDPTAEPYFVTGEDANEPVFIASDGTVYLITTGYAVDGSFHSTVHALNDATIAPVVVPGYQQWALHEGAEGDLILATYDNQNTIITVVNDPTSDPITVPGYPADPTVSSNGNDYLVVGNGLNSDYQETVLYVLNRPDVEPVVLVGDPNGIDFGPDGTIYLAVYDRESNDTTIWVIAAPTTAVV